MVQRVENINVGSGVKTVGRRSPLGSEEYDFYWNQSMKESKNRRTWDEAAAKDAGHDKKDKKNPITRQSGREQPLVGQ